MPSEGVLSEDAFSEDALSEDALSEEELSEDALSEDALSEEELSEDALSEEELSEDALSEDALSEDVLSGEAGAATLSEAGALLGAEVSCEAEVLFSSPLCAGAGTSRTEVEALSATMLSGTETGEVSACAKTPPKPLSKAVAAKKMDKIRILCN